MVASARHSRDPVKAVERATVAITADRRRDEQAVLLERAGLDVVMYPLVCTEPEDMRSLESITQEICRNPPEFFVANTGYGMRTWLDLAERWGLLAALVKTLGASSSMVARGAKALGELRKVGLDALYTAPGGTIEEVVEHLVHKGLAGKSVVVQLHGEPAGTAVTALRAAGAEVLCLPVYKMGRSGERTAGALVDVVLEGCLDAVSFTAAPQVHAMAGAARALGVMERLAGAFSAGGLLAACIGPVCAGAARQEGITNLLVPEHPRLGSLASALGAHFADHAAGLDLRQSP